MSLTLDLDRATEVATLTLDGKVTKEDFEEVAGPLERFIEANEKVRILEVIKSFEGFEPSVLIRGSGFDLRNMSKVSHVAVVSDIGWISPITQAAAAVTPIRMRSYGLSAMAEAREWLETDAL